MLKTIGFDPRTPISTEIPMPEYDTFKLEVRAEDFIVVLSLGGILLGTARRCETHHGRVSTQWYITGIGQSRYVFGFDEIAEMAEQSLAGGM